MRYNDFVVRLATRVPRDLVNLSLPRPSARPPTQAFSDFAIHREQGDWAEGIVMKTLQENLIDYTIVKYGRTDDVMAGEPEFKSFFDRYRSELDTIGKRPDLLLFSPSTYPADLSSDISLLDIVKLADIVRKALAGFEVRSSSFLSKEYSAQMQPEEGKRRTFLSFTVKVEDLIVILKWVKEYNVPHFYIQVLFDEVYVIPFHKIIELITDRRNKGDKFTIERNEKNQRKTTIHIDLRQGLHLGDVVEPPEHYSAVKHLQRGRLLHYVKFRGGKISLDTNSLSSLIRTATELKRDL